MRYTAIQCDTIHTHAVSKRCRAELEQIPAPQHVGCYSISWISYGESLAKAQIFMDLKDSVAVSHFGFPFWCSAGSIFPSWARRLEASWDAGHWSGGRIWLFKQSHDFSMALIERNRWFTELKFSMVDLSMANCECHNQMDIRKWRELWISQRSASPHRRRWSVVRCVSNFLGWLSRIWNGQWLWTTGDQRVGWSLFREA